MSLLRASAVRLSKRELTRNCPRLPERSLDMTCNLLVRCEPHAWSRLHLRHQPIEHRDPRAMPDDVRVHRQDEDSALLVGAIEFRFPD